jgi:DNA-binding response OmpR family regulator
MSKTIWIIEEDSHTHSVYRNALEKHFRILLFSDFKSFETALQKSPHPPHLIIAELRSRDDFIFKNLSTLPKSMNWAPFVVVSALDDADALRACFENGAVDHIVKPLRGNELLAKVEKAMERLSSSFDLDPSSLTVWNHRKRSEILTPKEFQIMAVISGANGRQVTREQLIRKIWDNFIVSEKTFDVHLSNLRKKIRSVELEIRYTAPYYRLIRGAGVSEED